MCRGICEKKTVYFFSLLFVFFLKQCARDYQNRSLQDFPFSSSRDVKVLYTRTYETSQVYHTLITETKHYIICLHLNFTEKYVNFEFCDKSNKPHVQFHITKDCSKT